MFRFATESLSKSPASTENGKLLQNLQIPNFLAHRGETTLAIRARGHVELVLTTSPKTRRRQPVGGAL